MVIDLEKAYKGLDALESATDDKHLIATFDFCRRFLNLYARETEPFQELEINVYDEEEIRENCTVQILRNSITGKTSIGWWENAEV